MNAPLSGGEFVTKPIRFQGSRLLLNHSTSAAGSIRIEVQNENGQPIPGFALADAPELYGDSLEQPALWKDGSDMKQLAGKVVRLRFVAERRRRVCDPVSMNRFSATTLVSYPLDNTFQERLDDAAIRLLGMTAVDGYRSRVAEFGMAPTLHNTQPRG